VKKAFPILVLLLFVGAAAFAASKSSWMTSFNKPGHLNVYADVGLYSGGFDVSGGAEYIVGDFSLGSAPFEWGVMAQALFGFPGGSGIDWGVGPLASLHWGTNFGGLAKFDFFVSAGVGVYGGPLGFTFATFDGATWQFTNEFGLLLEFGYIGHSMAGIGVIIRL
jgi:hypothetical protein